MVHDSGPCRFRFTKVGVEHVAYYMGCKMPRRPPAVGGFPGRRGVGYTRRQAPGGGPSVAGGGGGGCGWVYECAVGAVVTPTQFTAWLSAVALRVRGAGGLVLHAGRNLR